MFLLKEGCKDMLVITVTNDHENHCMLFPTQQCNANITNLVLSLFYSIVSMCLDWLASNHHENPHWFLLISFFYKDSHSASTKTCQQPFFLRLCCRKFSKNVQCICWCARIIPVVNKLAMVSDESTNSTNYDSVG